MIFYLITHKLYPGLPEPGSTCHHAESLSKQEESSWQAAKKRSLCDTHRRAGNLKNESQITASTSLLPFDTARGAGSLVTQHLQNPAVSLVLIISQRCEASLGTCSSFKTKWQLCNLSLWHIMETQKPEVTQLSPFQLQAEGSWVSPIFTLIPNGLVATFVPVHISDHKSYFYFCLPHYFWVIKYKTLSTAKFWSFRHSQIMQDLPLLPTNITFEPPGRKTLKYSTFLCQEVETS